jgi:hypothetical protein
LIARQYDEILAAAATTAPKPVHFVFSPNVQNFTFMVLVSAPAQYEHGWVAVSPASLPIMSLGSTATLAGTVYDQVGRVQADGITWSSSDAFVATVNASMGEVTAVGPGTATIHATSTVNARRKGTREVTVGFGGEV